MLRISKILGIAKFSFRELLKGKFFLFTVLGALGIIISSFISAEFTYGVPARVAIDIGMGVLGISSVVIAAIVGQSILYEEIESRTIYMMVTRPVSRSEFLLGKILGLLGLISLNVIVLSVVTYLITTFYQGVLGRIYIFAIMFVLIEAAIIILWSLMMSLMTSRLITGLSTFVVYFVGHFIGEVKDTSFVTDNLLFKNIVWVIDRIFPMFYKINLKNFVIYPTQVKSDYIFWGAGYGLLYIVILVLICLTIFKQRELD